MASRDRNRTSLPLAFKPNDRIVASQQSILIIEDDPLMAMALKDELEVEGYRVIAVADNGPEAVAIAAQYAPELIIADIRINGPLDGIDAVHAIKQRLQTKVIFVTAHTDPETRRRMEEVRFSALIPKPYTSGQLLAAVSDVFEQPD
jgi:two-component system, response regulator PdtaR